ncbi:MAG: FliM/FliN family flagellar motor switch protein [Clostridia bacterium]
MSAYTEYDFRQPHPVPRPHREAARTVLETWARVTGNKLTMLCREPITLTLDVLEQTGFQQLTQSWPALMVVSAYAGGTRIVFATEVNTALRLFDRWIGGEGVAPKTPRELTEFETSTWHDILTDWNSGFRLPSQNEPCWTWPALSVRTEFSPSHIAWGGDSDWVMMARFTLNWGEPAPLWCIWGLADFALDAAEALRRQQPPTVGPHDQRAWNRVLEASRVRLSLRLPPLPLPTKAVRDLAAGQLLAWPVHRNDPLVVTINGTPKATAVMGTVAHHRGMKLLSTWMPPADAALASVEEDLE